MPHAFYRLAEHQGEPGVVTRNFDVADHALAHGNELLQQRDPDYPVNDDSRYVRTPLHTVQSVGDVLRDARVRLPLGWAPPPEVGCAAEAFGGYLLLDAWIANTDRHHLNWGRLVDRRGDSRYLAPTFDHASSLGSHETDANRTERLRTRDRGRSVERYVQRPQARSALYNDRSDKRPLTLMEALLAWQRIAPTRAWWQRLLDLADDRIQQLVAPVAGARGSGPAADFAGAILRVNRRRILEAMR